MEANQVEVIYAMQDQVTRCHVHLDDSIQTVEQVIKASGILQKNSDIDITQQAVGIYNKIVALQAPVTAGDRIEIYRPLVIDPKQARRIRAEKKRQKEGDRRFRG